MKSREISFALLALGMSFFVATAFSHSHARAQDCGYDTKKNPIPCPEDQGGKKKKKTPIVYPSYTPTPTDTPKPTDTPVPTATGTQAANCIDCPNGAPGTGGQSGSPNEQAPNPVAGRWLPWLIGFGGILLGLVVGAIAGAYISRRRGQETSPAAPTLHDEAGHEIDYESTLFIKLHGDSLLRFQPRLSTANQLSKVEVRAYDPVHKKEIVGSTTPSSELGSSLPQEKGNQPEDVSDERIRKAVSQIHEQQIRSESDGAEAHLKKKD